MSSLKYGFVTLLGLPNAGKSSLFNSLVGEPIAIVTAKAQTTRNLMRGFAVTPELRLVVTDTPGLQEGTKALNQALAKNAQKAISNATEGREVLCFVFDTMHLHLALKTKSPTHLDVIRRFVEGANGKEKINVPVMIVFNKADLLRPSDDRKRIEQTVLSEFEQYFENVQQPIWMQSKNSDDLEKFYQTVYKALPGEDISNELEELFSEDNLTDQNTRDIAAEYIREQCFLNLGDELPYSIAISIESFKDKDPKMVRIEAIIHVEKEGQKRIVIGAGGSKVKEIGMKSRKRIESLLGTNVFLGLKVKVSENWTSQKNAVERFGYELH